MKDDDFQLQPIEQHRKVAPIEPLHTMLHEAPLSAVDYLYHELSRIKTEKELDDIVPSLGITRKKAIEQTLLVLRQRKHGDSQS